MSGLHVDESGPVGGPVVVLVHGSMDRSSGFVQAARRLDDDLRVVRYDRRGYGRSTAVGPPFGMAAQVADVLQVLGGRRAAIVGHSYGGVVALATAARHPDAVLAVGIYEIPMAWLPWWPLTTAGGDVVQGTAAGRSPPDIAEGFMRRMVGDERWDRLPSATREARRAEGYALVGELLDLHTQPPFDPVTIACPVRIARGEHAANHHLEGSAVTSRWFDSPVAVLPGAGHGGHASHPDGFAAFVRDVVAAMAA